nr:eukaryotic translation initiation factor 3 subunit K [Tanacetum cinerariifolium]
MTTGVEESKNMSYTVEHLVSVNPYNPDILPNLQNYVNEQVSSESYSLDANLCLIRLYQALMAMPAPDFSLCLFLIPERVQMDEQFKTLILLFDYLETAKFRQFWDEAAKARHILDLVPGFEQAIRNYAIHVLSLTYQKLPSSVLVEAINLEGPSLDKFLEHYIANNGWVVEKGQGKSQLISLPANEFNHPELKRITADSIPLDHITRIFPVLG